MVVAGTSSVWVIAPLLGGEHDKADRDRQVCQGKYARGGGARARAGPGGGAAPPAPAGPWRPIRRARQPGQTGPPALPSRPATEWEDDGDARPGALPRLSF